MMQTFRASLALAFALVCPLALLPAEAPAQEGPTGVQVDQVRAEPLSQTSPVIGRIVTRQPGRVAARGGRSGRGRGGVRRRLLKKVRSGDDMVAIPGIDHLGQGFAAAVLSFTRGIVRSRVLALAVAAATTVVAGGSALYFLPKLEYLPEGNRNLIFGVILPPPGYNLETKTAIAERIEDASRPLWASETGPEPEPGGPPKIRHFFMSTLTSVFGMLPLVVFPGAGSELYRGLGSVVIGGLSLSAVLTLLLIPPMLSVLLVKGEAMVRGAEALPEPAPAE